MRISSLALSVAAILLGAAGCRQSSSPLQDSPAHTEKGIAMQPQETPGTRDSDCGDLPSAEQLRKLLNDAANAGEAGGLAGGRFEWAAVVNRQGLLCAAATSTDDAAAPWPGSQSIAKAKAYTANAFSTDTSPTSTARLYTMSLPGHSLFGAGAADPFNPECLVTPNHGKVTPRVCGGVITFGGGVPLYRGKSRVGGLGASGDTPCADHEIAKRMRDAAGLNPPAGALADDITYSSADGASVYTHPLCPNTWRNKVKIGDEAPAKDY